MTLDFGWPCTLSSPLTSFNLAKLTPVTPAPSRAPADSTDTLPWKLCAVCGAGRGAELFPSKALVSSLASGPPPWPCRHLRKSHSGHYLLPPSIWAPLLWQAFHQSIPHLLYPWAKTGSGSPVPWPATRVAFQIPPQGSEEIAGSLTSCCSQFLLCRAHAYSFSACEMSSGESKNFRD